ncbi:MAG: glycosyltransferase [Thermoleophilaceae bacterium]|nr:glycosyltransferase [Thermoleophilaceae bacterium]
MNARPLVSCIVAAYNYARFLPRALDSALAQDYEGPLEIVVVDDGSTDDTPEVVAPYLDRVRYVRKPNGGVVSAVNRGVAEASGEFLAFLSADDAWPPHKVSRQVEHLLANPEVGLLYSDLEVIDENDELVHRSYWAEFGITPRRGRLLPLLVRGNIVSGGGMMLRADLAPLVFPIPDVGAWEDWWTALQVSRVAQIDFLPEPLYRYRLHGRNMNLGAGGPARAELVRTELRFRGWMLAELDDPQLGLDDYVAVYRTFIGHARWLAERDGVPLDRVLVPAPDGERAAEAAWERAARLARAGAPEAAARELLRAIGNAPWRTPALAAVEPLLAELDRGRSPTGAAGSPGALAARRFRTIAFAEELLERPELLDAYARAFGPGDDASLVLLAPALPESELLALLQPLEDRLPARGGETADVVALPGWAGGEAALADQAHALLSGRRVAGPLGLLHLIDGDGAAASARAAAERLWAAAGAAAEPSLNSRPLASNTAP